MVMDWVAFRIFEATERIFLNRLQSKNIYKPTVILLTIDIEEDNVKDFLFRASTSWDGFYKKKKPKA